MGFAVARVLMLELSLVVAYDRVAKTTSRVTTLALKTQNLTS
jgi:hypothetical protein